MAQLTLRAAILGVVLAVIMAAGNTYLGLFAGMTIASAIPSAVISMAILKLLGGSTILENNIVQTTGSAGSSTATGVIFTAPALVMLGYWSDYPYWWIFAFAALGGVLGVLFTVPLRRALIVDQKLRFPEGTAAAEVLRAGADPTTGAMLLAKAAAFGAAVKLSAGSGFRVVPDSLTHSTFWGKGISFFGIDVSMAVLGVGYICGLNVGIALAAGSLIAFDVALPYYTTQLLANNTELAAAVQGLDAEAAANRIWRAQIRYIGVGMMVIGGLWTLFSIRTAIVNGVRSALSASRRAGTSANATDETENDLSLKTMLIGIGLCIVPLFFLYHSVVGSLIVSIPMTLAMVVLAFVFCAVSAYMTGVVGGSNDPVSGMIIATILAGSALLLALTGGNTAVGPVAAVMIGAAVCCALCTASDNLQDLKCGQIVGATPWRQQAMLAVGVITSALILAPMLNLIASAYGIGTEPTALHPKPLNAPQAVLINSVAKGLFGGQLPWGMVQAGLILGVLVIVLDEWLKRGTRGWRAPVLVVAVGVYLPMGVVMPILLGGMIAWLVARRRRAQGATEHHLGGRGALAAAGMIAGESLTGVLIAVPIVVSGRPDVLAVAERFQPGLALGAVAGVALLAVGCSVLFRSGSR